MNTTRIIKYVCLFLLGFSVTASVRIWRADARHRDDVATMLQHEADWRRDCVVAGCAEWVTSESGEVEWEWVGGSAEE